MPTRSIGERVRLARESLKWDQNTLADKAGMRQATVSDIERDRSRGERSLPKLADALNVRLEWLLNGEGDMRPTQPTQGWLKEHTVAYNVDEKFMAISNQMMDDLMARLSALERQRGALFARLDVLRESVTRLIGAARSGKGRPFCNGAY